MYQSDRGNYKKEDSLFSMFWHSCLGKFIILGTIIGIIALIAALTCPSEKYMREEMNDNIRQCLERSDSIYLDGIDNMLANIGYIFSKAESEKETDITRLFKKHNHLEYANHGVFATMQVINNFHYEGITCGIGIFGIVIPTINFKDLVLRNTPVHKDYNYKPGRGIDDDDVFFGELDFEDDLIYQDTEEIE